MEVLNENLRVYILGSAWFYPGIDKASQIQEVTMQNEDCKYHRDHENRITRLEHDMEEIKKDNKKQSITVATISLIGVIITAMSSFAGVVFTAFMKSKGVF